jgi:hypothetical protein
MPVRWRCGQGASRHPILGSWRLSAVGEGAGMGAIRLTGTLKHRIAAVLRMIRSSSQSVQLHAQYACLSFQTMPAVRRIMTRSRLSDQWRR